MLLTIILWLVFDHLEFSWGPPLVHFGLRLPLVHFDLQNFGGESREIKISSRLIQETSTLRKEKNPRFYFFYRVENQISLISWSNTVHFF